MKTFIGILSGLIGVTLYMLATTEAQQQPYTTYPLHAKIPVLFTDQVLEVEQCLVVTAQGHAVVLEYPCPR